MRDKEQYEMFCRECGFGSLDLILMLTLLSLVGVLIFPLLKSTVSLEAHAQQAERSRLLNQRIRDALLAEEPYSLRELPTVEVLNERAARALSHSVRPVSPVIRMMVPYRAGIYRAIYPSGSHPVSPVHSSPTLSNTVALSNPQLALAELAFVPIHPSFLEETKNPPTRWLRVTSHGNFTCDGTVPESADCTQRPSGIEVGAVALRDDVLFFIDAGAVFRRVSLVTGSSQPIANDVSTLSVTKVIPIKNGSLTLIAISGEGIDLHVPLLIKQHSLQTLELFS